MPARTFPRSLSYATDFDLLAVEGSVHDRGSYLRVISPSNPHHYWGNLLLFREPPVAGDRERWERLFRAEFKDEPRVRHYTFGWDGIDGEVGAAEEEFRATGYDLDRAVVLTGAPGDIVTPPKCNSEVEVRTLDPADDAAWDTVVERHMLTRESRFGEGGYRQYATDNIGRLRRIAQRGHGAWFGAYLDGRMVADLGLYVFQGRGRFQSVGTHPDFRRRGICGRLVRDAALAGFEQMGAKVLVMVADEGYHAARIYESVGLRPTEKAVGVCLPPPTGMALS